MNPLYVAYKAAVLKTTAVTACLILFLASCTDHKETITQKEVVEKPEDIDAKAGEMIRGTLSQLLETPKDLPDSLQFKNAAVLNSLYNESSFTPLWVSNGVFTDRSTALYRFIEDSAKMYGLFPNDYSYKKLTRLKAQLTDSLSDDKKLDASLWAYTDLLYTAAFVQLIKDIKIGRLLPDSLSKKELSLNPPFYATQLKSFAQNGTTIFAQLEPENEYYQKLKAALPGFLSKANLKTYTYVKAKDSLQLRKLIYKRIGEEDSAAFKANFDSAGLAKAVKWYQQRHKLTADGKISPALIRKLNTTDKEKFIRIAITLDRYKQLQKLPEQYIWVNLPSYKLELIDGGSVAVESKIIVGKPATRTPEITSAISNMITYPQWSIPPSIIKKEILPGLQRNPGYTQRKGFSLVDARGNEVDPFSVNWSKYKNGIPYRVVQGSGDANALGVLKFNFANKYAVYLHDTNQRYFFSRASRALSHGCVRVQNWKGLATFILKNDSLHSENAVPVDSMYNWLVLKEKHYIPVRNPIPLFIRYYTCSADENGIVFYDDIYGEDKRIRETIFRNK